MQATQAPEEEPSDEFAAVRSPGRRLGRRGLAGSWPAMAGLVVLTAAVIAGVLGPPLLSAQALHQSLLLRLQPPVWIGGTWAHPLGTDPLGRDVLARIVVASRVSLEVGLLAVALSAAIGGLVGLAAGYYGRTVDRVLMRLVDIQLSVPYILLAIAIIAVLGPSLRNVILALGVGGWTTYARILRGQAQSIRRREFVEAATAAGTRDHMIILRHILPQTLGTFLVVAAIGVGQVIVTESALSFLGLGVQPPDVTWGTMVGDGRNYLSTAWWVATFPGLALMLVIIAINLVADWLSETFDPLAARGR
jgi:peptide/nickel transport system permease protein